ncbi:MAG: ABC transporter permease [Lachnospiraceae bacterium]|nr:ABC transporter permease [Lachnospiraceae bacterium]
MKKKLNTSLIIGLIIMSVLLLLLIVNMFYQPYGPNEMNGAEKLKAPSISHIMGTDNYGRDIYVRVIEGMKVTFVVAVSTVAIGLFFGILIGAFTGYYGGVLDEVLMRLNDALASFPSILLALIFVSILGSGQYKIILSLGIIFIPSFARIVRSEFIRLKHKDYVKSARLMGASDIRVMFVHMLPNTVSTIITAVAIGFNNAVLAESGMSFLGIGVQPPNASLGRMLSEAKGYIFSAPWASIFPGLMIILLILAFVLISEGVSENA